MMIIWCQWHAHNTAKMASCETSLVSLTQQSGHVAGRGRFVLRFILIYSSLLFTCTCRPVIFQVFHTFTRSHVHTFTRSHAHPFIQEEVYNGKDCVHALKFQTVMLADGIISHVSGPWNGRRHDTHIFNNSELPQTLSELPRMSHEDGGELMAIYADPGKIRPCSPIFSSLTIIQDTH